MLFWCLKMPGFVLKKTTWYIFAVVSAVWTFCMVFDDFWRFGLEEKNYCKDLWGWQMSSDHDPCDIPLFWLVYRDPCIGFLQSLYNWVPYNPLYIPTNQVFFPFSVVYPILFRPNSQAWSRKIAGKSPITGLKWMFSQPWEPTFPVVCHNQDF